MDSIIVFHSPHGFTADHNLLLEIRKYKKEKLTPVAQSEIVTCRNNTVALVQFPPELPREYHQRLLQILW